MYFIFSNQKGHGFCLGSKNRKNFYSSIQYFFVHFLKCVLTYNKNF